MCGNGSPRKGSWAGRGLGRRGSGSRDQQGFALVEAGPGVVAGGVVQEVGQALFGGGAVEESVRGGVVLPEVAQVAGLPAFDGLGRLFVAGVRGELVLLAQRRTLARSVLKLRRRSSWLAQAL